MVRCAGGLLGVLLVCAVLSAREPVRARHAMVVAEEPLAADAGVAVLKSGGNAVDAAVAVGFALAVTHPFAGNLGGGGFMVVRTADGLSTTFDDRETAPAKSTPTMYLGKDGQIDISLTASGYLAPGVPGTVRGMALAHKRFGKLAWKDVVLPAFELADKGFPIAASLARGLNNEITGRMKPFPASVAAYGRADGKPWVTGDRLVLGDLAKSLRAIATDGPDVFYTGWIADRIAEDMAANGGLITKDDLGAYRAKERAPVRGTFLGFDVISMPPPSSGGIALIEMLNMLESLQIQKTKRGSVEAIHLIAEAMRRAYLDRARSLGDADFVTVPVADLLAKSHARDLIKTIDRKKASSSAELGKDLLTAGLPAEADDTTHFSVIDKDGMAVSNTYTLEGGYGSHVVVKGAGFLLNNEMGDFNKNPGVTLPDGTIGTPANLIDPGKRMLSSMTPTIVSKGGKVVLITGSPGGRTIINTVFGVVFAVTEFGMNVRAAVDAPRMNHQWMPDTVSIERSGATEELLGKLRAMGHTVNPGERAGGAQGDANSIGVDAGGTAWGASDKRSADGKASVARLTSTAARQ